MPKALISGITGQDGSYLAEHLLNLDYEVDGLIRRTSSPNLSRIAHLGRKVRLHPADLLDHGSLQAVIAEVEPDEIYNLAAQSFVHVSWDQPILTAEVTGLGAMRMLEAIRLSGIEAKFYQASSSEMFGKVREEPQTELTPFHPRSPYGAAKAFAHWVTVNYRESHGLYTACGILFNHESPRRGEEFVTRKISKAVANIKMGLQEHLVLGNLQAMRDWGHARDYVCAMHSILQQDQPDDYVIATGEKHSVQEFLELAFDHVGLDYRNHVTVDPTLFRPAEVSTLLGDYSKAKNRFGWFPRTSFQELVVEMVESDLNDITKA